MADVRLIETFDDTPVFEEAERLKKTFLELEQAAIRASGGMSDSLKAAGAGSDKFAESVTRATKTVMDEAQAIAAVNNALNANTANTNTSTAATAKLTKAQQDGEKAATQAAAATDKEAKAIQGASKAADDRAKKSPAELAAIKKRYDAQQQATEASIRATTADVKAANAQRQAGEVATALAEAKQLEAAASNAGAAAAGNAAGATEKLTIAQRLFNLVAKANPIGLIIAAVAGLIAILSKAQPVLDKIGQAFAAVNAVTDVLVNRLTTVGTAFSALFSGDFAQAGERFKAAFSGIGAELVDVAGKAIELEKAMQALQLRELQAAVGIRIAEDRRDKLVKFADDETQSIRARELALRQALAVEKNIAAQRIGFAKEEAANIIAQNANDRSNAAIEENNAAKIRVLDEQKDASERVLDIQAKINELLKKSAEDERKLLEQLLKDLEKLRVETATGGIEQDLAAQNKKYDDLGKLAESGIERLNELEKTRLENGKTLSAEEIAQREEFGRLVEEVETRRLSALIEVLDKANEEEFQANEKQNKRKEELTKKEYEAAVKAIEQRNKINEEGIGLIEAQGQKQINILEQNGEKEEKVKRAQLELDRTIQALRLQNQIEANQALAAIATDPAEVERLLAEVARLKAEIEGLAILPKDKKKFKPLTFMEILGIDPESDLGKGLALAVPEALNAINTILDAQLKAAEAKRQMRQTEYDDAKSFFEKQQELAKAGETNELDRAKTQLAQRKAALLESFREEQKIKRQQLALDSVTQLSGLITSSVNIFKALSPLGPFGVSAAIGTIALMFGAFAVAKSRALQAINQDQPKLRQGKRITGRPHSQGGEPHVGIDGRRYEVEDREWVIGTEPSREHDKFLGDLNRGKFKGVNLNQLILQAGKPAPSPLAIAAPVMATMQRRHVKAKEQAQYGAMIKAYEKAADRTIRAIKEKPLLASIPGGYVEITETEGGRTRNFVEIVE